jgi:hypothetical protein
MCGLNVWIKCCLVHSAYRVSLVGLLAWCWGWIAGHCGGYPAKVSGHASGHGGTGRIGTASATNEATNTDLNIAVDEKRSATVSLH